MGKSSKRRRTGKADFNSREKRSFRDVKFQQDHFLEPQIDFTQALECVEQDRIITHLEKSGVNLDAPIGQTLEFHTNV